MHRNLKIELLHAGKKTDPVILFQLYSAALNKDGLKQAIAKPECAVIYGHTGTVCFCDPSVEVNVAQGQSVITPKLR